jgi:hypothetical protein
MLFQIVAHRADVAFDVAAKMGPCPWTMIELNSILLTTSHECIGMNFLSIVNVNHSRQASGRPGEGCNSRSPSQVVFDSTACDSVSETESAREP